MKKRIAKKVLNDVKRYRRPQITKACKRLGESVMVLGVDMAKEGTADITVTTTYNLDGVATGRFSSSTLNESTKPKTAFNHRTGKAPTTPGAIPPTSVECEGAEVLATITLKKGIIPWDAFSLADLKDMAKDRGLKGYSTMKKAELVALLKGG